MSSGQVRTAVLLAAGIGSRLGDSTDALPKCLLEVGGASMLQRLVDALSACGVTRLLIVVGYRQELIRQAGAELGSDIEIEFLVNEEFKRTNNIVSLWLARERVMEPFVLLESDLVFAPGLLEGMMVPDRIAVSELRPWMQGTRVSLGEGGRVSSFLFPPFAANSGQYKTVNIYSLSPGAWGKVIDCLGRYVAEGRVGLYYEHCFAQLLESGDISLDAHHFPAGQWYEVDTAADLRQANSMFSTGSD